MSDGWIELGDAPGIDLDIERLTATETG